MSNPDWFVLIQQWRLKGMGEYGITLPFIVGALGYKSGETNYQAVHVQDVLNKIINNPVDGYITEVRWCSNIDAPVFSVSPIDNPYRMDVKSSFPRKHGGGISIGFSVDLHASDGLDCKDAQECYDKLITYAEEYVKNCNFSRNRSGEENNYEYGKFNGILYNF